MKIATLDFETYYDKSDYSLSKLATEAYIRDPRFEIIGVAVKIEDKKTKWFSGTKEATRKWLLKQCDWSQYLALSHNAHFDMAILLWHLDIRPKGFLDTLSMANALYGINESVSLAALAEKHGLPPKGTAVLNASGKHRVDFTEQELEDYADYCIHDTVLCRRLFDLMIGGFCRDELRLIDLTIRMFVEPKLELNRQLLENHLHRTREEQQRSLDSLAEMLKVADTNEVKKVIMSNPKFASLLRKLKVEPPMKISATTGKETYAFAKTDEAFTALLEHDNPVVQAAMAARLGNKSTIEETRTETFIEVSKRGTFPFPLKYSGAEVTHRWSGFDYNVQNMGRKSKLRQAICAPKGYVVLAADQKSIELVLGLYMACQDDKVKLIADGVDLYVDIATTIFNMPYGEIVDLGKQCRERTTGKVVQLSSIYGTGHVKLKDTLRIQGGVRFDLGSTQRMTDLYRTDYHMVVKAWEQGQDVLDSIYHWKDFETDFLRPGILKVTPLGIIKPNGLVLGYPDLKWKDFAYSYAQKRGKRDKVYGSKVFQRCIQSLARDIIGLNMLQIDKKYRVVGTVHDEIICLVRKEEVEEARDYITQVMRTPPIWAPGLPLDVEIGVGDNYGEAH